jgi:hypothetical protein
MSCLRKTATLMFVALFLTGLIAALPSTAQNEQAWTTQTVDTSGYAWSNGHCPITLDSKGNPHIAYTGIRIADWSSTPLVMYASWNGTGLSTKEIAQGNAFSLALDRDDNPHILYTPFGMRGYDGSLIYASWTGKEWTNQTVESKGVGYGVVALDSSGIPHIAYIVGQEVKYASWTDSNWTIQTVDTFPEIPIVTLAIDKNGTAYVLYDCTISIEHNGNYFHSENLRLATWQNSNWSIQNITIDGAFGGLVVDSKGYPHVYYGDETAGGDLVYASLDGASWRNQTLVFAERIGLKGLALDFQDMPHISYTLNGKPMYASWTGTYWNTRTASLTGNLAIDSDGNPHISYLGRPAEKVLNMRVVYVFYATAIIPPLTPTPTPPSAVVVFLSERYPAIITVVFIALIIAAVLANRWKKGKLSVAPKRSALGVAVHCLQERVSGFQQATRLFQ